MFGAGAKALISILSIFKHTITFRNKNVTIFTYMLLKQHKIFCDFVCFVIHLTLDLVKF